MYFRNRWIRSRNPRRFPAPEETNDAKRMKHTHNNLLAGEAAPQDQSPLFSILPPEVRSHICALALTDYPDPNPDRQYSTDTCYIRPSYFAPRKTDTALLRTCKAIYRECWHMPFTLKEQVHWLTASDRAPPEYRHYQSESRNLGERLKSIVSLQGENSSIIDHLRVFAQMWALEQGDFEYLLNTPLLKPRVVTLTLRHTDWWFWENDEPLRFEADWIRGVSQSLSDVTCELRIELESTKRRKKQIDEIANKMIDRWSFKKPSGVVMYADATPGATEVTEWSGNSSWNYQRWVRDEVEENRIDYYVVTVTFRPEAVLDRRRRTISDNARKLAAREDIWTYRRQGVHPMRLDVADPGPLFTGQAYLSLPDDTMECGTGYFENLEEEDWTEDDGWENGEVFEGLDAMLGDGEYQGHSQNGNGDDDDDEMSEESESDLGF